MLVGDEASNCGVEPTDGYLLKNKFPMTLETVAKKQKTAVAAKPAVNAGPDSHRKLP